MRDKRGGGNSDVGGAEGETGGGQRQHSGGGGEWRGTRNSEFSLLLPLPASLPNLLHDTDRLRVSRSLSRSVSPGRRTSVRWINGCATQPRTLFPNSPTSPAHTADDDTIQHTVTPRVTTRDHLHPPIHKHTYGKTSEGGEEGDTNARAVKGRQAARIRDRMRFSQRCEVNAERKGEGREEDKIPISMLTRFSHYHSLPINQPKKVH